MRQIGACKLGEPLEGGRAALRALAIYCSDDIPGAPERVLGFKEAMEEDASRLLDILKSAEGITPCPEVLSGERVSPTVDPSSARREVISA